MTLDWSMIYERNWVLNRSHTAILFIRGSYNMKLYAAVTMEPRSFYFQTETRPYS